MDEQPRDIIDVKDEWPLWQRTLANLVNSSATFVWLFVTYYLLIYLDGKSGLPELRNASLNIVVPNTAYGILTLIVGLTLVSWLFPYFSYRKLSIEGTPLERSACMMFWGIIALSISIIIASGIK